MTHTERNMNGDDRAAEAALSSFIFIKRKVVHPDFGVTNLNFGSPGIWIDMQDDFLENTLIYLRYITRNVG